MSSSVSQTRGVSEPVWAELQIENVTASYHQDPPPPYSITNLDEDRQTVVHQTIIVQPNLKNRPTYYECPKCRKRNLTSVEYVNTRSTHLMAGFICGFTCWCALCCLAALPYLVTNFKKANHYCSNCGELLGSYSRV